MKRILKSLAKLYPATWRSRYGAEYEALLEDGTPRAGDAINILWGAMTMHVTARSFVRMVLPCALAGVLAGMAISFRMPVLYTSGTVIAEQDESQGRQLRVLAKGVFANREAMATIIREHDLYPHERAKMPLDNVIREMQSAILIRSVSRSSLEEELRAAERITGHNAQSSEKTIHYTFAVQFEYADPRVAMQVEWDLMQLLSDLHFKPGSAPVVYIVNAPSLPNKPTGLSGLQFSTIGLLGGLLGGLILAATLGSKHSAAGCFDEELSEND